MPSFDKSHSTKINHIPTRILIKRNKSTGRQRAVTLHCYPQMQATFCLEEKLASVTSQRAIKSLAVKLSRCGGGAGLGLYHGLYRGATHFYQ